MPKKKVGSRSRIDLRADGQLTDLIAIAAARMRVSFSDYCRTAIIQRLLAEGHELPPVAPDEPEPPPEPKRPRGRPPKRKDGAT